MKIELFISVRICKKMETIIDSSLTETVINSTITEIQKALINLQTQMTLLHVKMDNYQSQQQQQQPARRFSMATDLEEEAIEDVHCLLQFFQRISCLR